ncbi:MAG: HAD family hydrolase [Phycisphaerales bacterium]
MQFDAVICDIDGCLGPESHHPLDANSLARLADHNRRAIATHDVPIIALASGRPYPFVECLCRLMANTVVPCISENGVWLYDPAQGDFLIDPAITPVDLASVASLTQWIARELGPKGVVMQPGKSASISIYHPDTDYLMSLMPVIAQVSKDNNWPIRVSRTVRWINLDLAHVSKATGIARLIALSGLRKDCLAGVGDSLSDLAIAERVAFFACPNNADEKLKPHAHYVSPHDEIEGVLDIVQHLST